MSGFVAFVICLKMSNAEDTNVSHLDISKTPKYSADQPSKLQCKIHMASILGSTIKTEDFQINKNLITINQIDK